MNPNCSSDVPETPEPIEPRTGWLALGLWVVVTWGVAMVVVQASGTVPMIGWLPTIVWTGILAIYGVCSAVCWMLAVAAFFRESQYHDSGEAKGRLGG